MFLFPGFHFFPLVPISIFTRLSRLGIIFSPVINFKKFQSLPFLTEEIRLLLTLAVDKGFDICIYENIDFCVLQICHQPHI